MKWIKFQFLSIYPCYPQFYEAVGQETRINFLLFLYFYEFHIYLLTKFLCQYLKIKRSLLDFLYL